MDGEARKDYEEWLAEDRRMQWCCSGFTILACAIFLCIFSVQSFIHSYPSIVNYLGSLLGFQQ